MKKVDFNRDWYVKKDGQTAEQAVNLPHDAMIYEARDKGSATNSAGAYFAGGKYSYRKRFMASTDWNGKIVIMECEAVYQNASVYVNGELLAERPYGYSNFYVRLDQNIRIGEENEVIIVADNAEVPNSRWYSGSGVYRQVNLFVGEENAPAPEGIKVTVLNENQIRVDVESAGEFCARGLDTDEDTLKPSGNVNYKIEILDGESVVATAEGNHVRITIPNAKLWDEEHPNLYRCLVTAKSGKSAETVFGMRTLDWSNGSFLVNGREVKLRGACIHHDNGVLGAATFADAEYRRVRILKESGFNAIRCSHNPMSKAMLSACDELGVYVMDEAFDMWLAHKNPYDYADEKFKKWWKRDVAAMISKDYNHPSVVMYSIGNEISELGMDNGIEYCKKIADFVREMDASRAVTSGENLLLCSMAASAAKKEKDGKKEEKQQGAPTAEDQPTSIFFNILMNKMGNIMNMMAASSGATKVAEKINPIVDIPGYNYATSRYKKDCTQYPNRTFVGSETLPKYLYKNWELVKTYKNMAGDFMWTGWDYLGEAGIGTVTYKESKSGPSVDKGIPLLSGSGVIDICGFPRAEVGWNKSIWGLEDKPTIGVEPVTHANHIKAVSMWRNTDAVESWSWDGCEGAETEIVVYANAAKVRLVKNRVIVGIRPVKENKVVFKKVTYEPGELEAIALDASGNEIGRSALTSATGATKISLNPEREELTANGQDLCFVEVNLVGENGIVMAASDTELQVTVEGAGTLQGFGSARPVAEGNLYSGKYTTHYGKALAVVRAGYDAGNITVRVSGTGLETQTLTLRAN